MGKVAVIKSAFSMDATLQALPAIAQAKELIGLDGAEKGAAAATLIVQFLDKIALIKREFAQEESISPSDAIRTANLELGLPEQTGTLVAQANAIMELIQ